MTRATKAATEPLLLRVATDLELPADAVVTEKLGWLGRTGSGKTYGAMQLAEQMLDAGVQVLALDPVGVWPGLRMDGPPWPVYILGGTYGDVPLDPRQGAEVARLLVRENLSAVLDVSQFGTQAEITRFAEAFATELFNAKKAAPGAMHLFLEEAQEFVPQNPDPSEARMLRAFERLWKLGRNYGVGGSLISQRPQELNKKALNQAGLMFVFNLTGPQERKAVEYWMSQHITDGGSAKELPKLQTGKPFMWMPGRSISGVISIPSKRSRDVSQTPRVGEAVAKRQTTSMDVDRLRTALDAVQQEVEAEAPATVAGRAFAAERAARVMAETALAESVEVVRLLEAQMLRILELARGAEVSVSGHFEHPVEEVAFRYRTTAAEAKQVVDQQLARHLASAPVRPSAPAQSERPLRELTGFEPGYLPGTPPSRGRASTEDRLLATLVSHGAMDERQLLLLAGYRKTGSYGAAMAVLRRKTLIHRNHEGLFEATPEGTRAARKDLMDALPSTRTERIHFWAQKLGFVEGRVLSALAAKPMPEAALLKTLNYRKTGSWGAAMAKLRRAKLIERRGTEFVLTL